MKGGRNIKEITIKIIGVGYNSLFQALVSVYDLNNNLIVKKETYNGVIKVVLEKNKIYKITAVLFNKRINTCFLVDSNNIYTFIFRRNDNPITFRLTDYYYKNLPIMKGEIIFWQK